MQDFIFTKRTYPNGVIEEKWEPNNTPAQPQYAIRQQVNTFSRQKFDTNMANHFSDRQRIRHVYDENTWIGEYDQASNKIFCNGNHYHSPSGFAMAHKRAINKNIFGSTNGWIECQIEVNGTWQSISR